MNSVPPDPQARLQELLRERLSQIRVRNPAFSIRAFASRLGISSGAMTAILNGKRRVSRKMAARFAESLNLDPQERSELLARFSPVVSLSTKPGQGEPLRYLQLSADQFQLVSEWQHFAILSLIKTQGFRDDPAWIARRLGITQSVALAALDRMKRIGLLALSAQGELERSAPAYRTTDDIPSSALRRSHAKNLELAASALERLPVEERDFTAVTMAVHPACLPKAKELVRKFQDELAEQLAPFGQTEVYKLCIQLFPLTQIDRSES